MDSDAYMNSQTASVLLLNQMNNGSIERDVTWKCAQNLKSDVYNSQPFCSNASDNWMEYRHPRSTFFQPKTMPKYFSSVRKQKQEVDLTPTLSIARTNMSISGHG